MKRRVLIILVSFLASKNGLFGSFSHAKCMSRVSLIQKIDTGTRVSLRQKGKCESAKKYLKAKAPVVYKILSTLNFYDSVIFARNLSYHKAWMIANVNEYWEGAGVAAIHLAARDCDPAVLLMLRSWNVDMDLLDTNENLTAKQLILEKINVLTAKVALKLSSKKVQSRSRRQLAQCNKSKDILTPTNIQVSDFYTMDWLSEGTMQNIFAASLVPIMGEHY